jgi:hypothetical protein
MKGGFRASPDGESSGEHRPALKGHRMLLIRFAVLVLAVVAAAVIAVLADVWWLSVLAVIVLFVLTIVAVLLVLHYAGAPEWLGAEEESELEDAGLVEPESGLPTRRRWNERRAREYAEEVARRGLVAVPEGWRGPEGAHRVLLVTTVPVTPDQLRHALPDSISRDELAVLVVVPTLAQSEIRFRLGDATEAVEHAEAVARETVAALRGPGVHVSGHIGPADPAVALSDGLRTYDAQRVVVMRNHPGARRYLEDVPLQEASETFHVPMTEVALEQPRAG